MSLSSVPDAAPSPLATALALAASAAPEHTPTQLPIHQDGRAVGVLVACACGWEVVRPSAREIEIEIALHQIDPTAWREDADLDVPPAPRPAEARGAAA